MTVQTWRSRTPSPGRPLKGGVKRGVVSIRMPLPLREVLYDVARQTEQEITDLGAYYLIVGLNSDRVANGLAPVEMPAYLVEAKRSADGRTETQEALLAAG